MVLGLIKFAGFTLAALTGAAIFAVLLRQGFFYFGIEDHRIGYLLLGFFACYYVPWLVKRFNLFN